MKVLISAMLGPRAKEESDFFRSQCQYGNTMTRTHWSTAVVMGGVLFSCTLMTSITELAASSLDQLTELTGKASVIVTLKGRDNFTSEYRYDISVRNHTSDLLIADSLVIVLDKITNLAGEDHEGLTGESFLTRFEVLGQDGETNDGKPFFRIPLAHPRTSAHSPIASLPASASGTKITSQSSRLLSKCWDKNVRRLSPNKPKLLQFSREPLRPRPVAAPSTS